MPEANNSIIGVGGKWWSQQQETLGKLHSNKQTNKNKRPEQHPPPHPPNPSFGVCACAFIAFSIPAPWCSSRSPSAPACLKRLCNPTASCRKKYWKNPQQIGREAEQDHPNSLLLVSAPSAKSYMATKPEWLRLWEGHEALLQTAEIK